jgi:molybdate transport system substrate-binding protein
MKSISFRAATIIGLWFALCFSTFGSARADELRVISSGGFGAACDALAPVFEKKSGVKLSLGRGPSMGDTADAVPQRLKRGEKIDVVIMVGYALGKLIADGQVTADSRADLARSAIGVVVRHGAAHPDISSVDALRRALLAARSVAYSDSASGVYVSNEMFKKLGIAEQMAGKARMIPAEPVGAVVARGDAEIGFQQISELKPIVGIDLLGPLPAEVQKYTVFSAGVVAGSAHSAEAMSLIRFLASPEAWPVVIDTGLEPIKEK